MPVVTAKAKLSRALGVALTPKAARCMERRPYPPGPHGRTRKTPSDYALRLREKQRLRHQYGIGEAQLAIAFDHARRASGKTGEVLVEWLEKRLDAVVWRSGLARTIYQARQLVVHRHITVNGRLVDRPSYQVNVDDVVAVAPRQRSVDLLRLTSATQLETPREYLEIDRTALRVMLVREPHRSEIPVICDEQLVVEYYSR